MTAKREAEPVLSPRERIIVAASDLFQKQGIRGVGVEAIAEAAGTNKMTLYRHFESKDELIAEWARGIIAKKEALWDELSAKYPDDPRQQLIEWSERVKAKLAEMERRGSVLAYEVCRRPGKKHNHPPRAQ